MTVPIVFRNGRVVDAQAPEPREGLNIVVEDDRIREVTDEPVRLSEAREIDLGGRVLMPGLIDCHNHIYLSELNLRKLAEVPLTLMAAGAVTTMRGILDRGFTTIRDAGGADWGIREAVERRMLAGPRMFIAGRSLTQTGGHGDQRLRTETEVEPCGCSNALSFTKAIADGVPEVRKAAREELRKGSNQIKIMISGGVASPSDPLESRQYSGEEIRAIVEEAESWGTYAMAHAYTADAVNHAVSNGVRTIEHGNLIDADAARLMKDKGAYMVPTLVTYDAMERHGAELGLPPVSQEKLKVVLEAGLRSIEICKEAGVPMGLGTDLLGPLQIEQSREFLIRAEVLSPHEVICQATRVNAEILNKSGELGIIAEGALADMLVVDGNPLDDLGLLQDQGAHLAAIMKGGEFHKNQLNA
ncbi:MAG: amidohydrolase family protein [Alphaproteobacteria bacterium]